MVVVKTIYITISLYIVFGSRLYFKTISLCNNFVLTTYSIVIIGLEIDIRYKTIANLNKNKYANNKLTYKWDKRI